MLILHIKSRKLGDDKTSELKIAFPRTCCEKVREPGYEDTQDVTGKPPLENEV